MNGQSGRYARLRYTAAGALAALAAVGAIAGTGALAASPGAKTHGHLAAVNCSTKTAPAPNAPTPAAPAKTPGPGQAVDPRPFFEAIQQLVDNGTITATQGQAVDREIQSGEVATGTLASSGLTPTQLQAVQQALADGRRALAQHVRQTCGGHGRPRRGRRP